MIRGLLRVALFAALGPAVAAAAISILFLFDQDRLTQPPMDVSMYYGMSLLPAVLTAVSTFRERGRGWRHVGLMMLIGAVVSIFTAGLIPFGPFVVMGYAMFPVLIPVVALLGAVATLICTLAFNGLYLLATRKAA